MADAAQFTVTAMAEQEKREKEKAQSDKDAAARAAAQFKMQQQTQAAFMRVEAEKAKAQMKEQAKADMADDEISKKPIMVKILRYFEAFPELAKKVPKLSAKASKAECEETLNIIRNELSCARSLFRLHHQVNYGLIALESIWGDGTKAPAWVPPQMRVNLTGISKYFRDGMFRDEITPLLVELDIEYPWLGRSSLLMRTAETVAEMCAKTHLMNTNPEIAAKMMGISKEGAKDDVDLGQLPS